MKRLLLLAAISTALIASLGPASSPAAGAKLTHCTNVRYPPLYLTIKRVAEHGTSCGTAHQVALGYMRATTQSIGAHSHTGHCFGAHSYGSCTVHHRKQVFDCFHFQPVPAKHRGLVRCTRGETLVKFNIGT